MTRLPIPLLVVLLALPAAAAEGEGPAPADHLTRFGEGPGPRTVGDVLALLDGATHDQSNAFALDRSAEGARDRLTLTCRMRVLPGGDGGAFVFLDTAEHGVRGPAPFVKSWTEPNLPGAFAVGIDVHDPKNEEPFGPWGNYQGRPEREVSLHWDGREVVKRVAEREFRGDWVDVRIDVRHVCGGAEVDVRLGEEAVYDAYFVPGLSPREARLAIGAGTRGDATNEFDVRDICFAPGAPAAPARPPVSVEVFHHVRTDGARQSFETEVDLPPAGFAFGRVLLTLAIHDGGEAWDEWDRNGHLYVVDDEGVKRDILPFITSYRTECRFVVDVTHFRPWLAGRRRFEISAGTSFYRNRGFLMSATLEFCHGTPTLAGAPAEPFRVIPLWHGIAQYRDAANHFADFFADREVEIPEGTTAARIATTTTGHTPVGEFTPSKRTIVVRGGGEEARFPNTLWKDDCWLNPHRPQFGTWKYSRAGWAPGDVVRPWWIDLPALAAPGRKATFSYLPEPYDFSDRPETERPTEAQVNEAIHVVRSYLVLYRSPAGLVAAPVLRVMGVAPDSAAAKAGILAGDWLASYDGRTVDSLAALGAAKQAATEAGKTTVEVVVFRGPQRLILTLAAGQIGVELSAR